MSVQHTLVQMHPSDQHMERLCENVMMGNVSSGSVTAVINQVLLRSIQLSLTRPALCSGLMETWMRRTQQGDGDGGVREREKERCCSGLCTERVSNREGQQSHFGCCSMREWPVTPCLICARSALTHTHTHTATFSYMKNSHISLLLIDTEVRNKSLL